MTWTPADRWSERRESLRALLRFIGAAALCYVLAVSGGFSHSLLTGVLCVLAIGALLVTFIDRIVTGWWGVVAASVLTVSGSLLNVEVSPMGWIFFGIGCLNLIGLSKVSLRIAVPVCAVAATVIVAADLVGRSGDWLSAVWTALGALGLGSGAYARRQNIQRHEQERELVQRSRELEQRSLQLIEQTHKTQAETARAAALEERSRIARDIHDLLAHSLGGLVVQLNAADAVLQAGGDPRDVAGRIQSSRRLAIEGLREARNAVRELGRDEPNPDEAPVGLAERLRTIVDGPVGRQLKIDFDVLGDPRPVPAAVATAFGAVVREGLTNINKHAPGAVASATLLYGPSEIRLEMINALQAGRGSAGPDPITDDHCPDPADRTDLSSSGAGLGISGMSRRMIEIGGTLQAQLIGDRWQLAAEWPVPRIDRDGRTDLHPEHPEPADASTREWTT